MSLRYVVVYQSQTGNTKKIAEAVYESIEADDKRLVDIDEMQRMPNADVYFIGFNIHNENCSIDIIDCLEEISGGYVALFSSCGYVPTEEYKAVIERKVEVWLPEEAEYMGMYICQGRVQEDQKEIMRRNMPDKVDILDRMFEMGDTHPDIQDCDEAATFAKSIQTKVEHQGNIPIL